MFQVRIKAYGGLSRYLPGQKGIATFSVPEGATVRDLLRQAGIPEPEVWLVAAGDKEVKVEEPLWDGAELSVFAQVAGG